MSTDVLTGEEVSAAADYSAQQQQQQMAQQQMQQVQQALGVTSDQLKGATTAKEIIDHIDTVIVNYLDFMFDTIDRNTVIYPLYKTMVQHVSNKMKSAMRQYTYAVVAKVASTITIDLLSDLADKDHDGTFMTEEELNDL